VSFSRRRHAYRRVIFGRVVDIESARPADAMGMCLGRPSVSLKNVTDRGADLSNRPCSTGLRRVTPPEGSST
jgi:hypothetical protein